MVCYFVDPLPYIICPAQLVMEGVEYDDQGGSHEEKGKEESD